jgi:hypothetical protein
LSDFVVLKLEPGVVNSGNNLFEMVHNFLEFVSTGSEVVGSGVGSVHDSGTASDHLRA